MKYFNKIERYLKWEMTAEELEAFDKELAQNAELTKELELQQLEEDFLDFAVEEDLLATIKKIGSGRVKLENKQEAKVHRLIPWKRVGTIAVGLALLAVAYFAWPTQNPNLAIAQETYRNFPPNLSGTKSIDDAPQTFEKNKLFLQSDTDAELKAAISFFESQKATSPEAAYYLGHGYWKIGEYQKSVLNFEYFLEKIEANNRLVPQAEFYKTLALLATDRVAEAKRFILEKKEGHLFQKQLEALLERI